MRRNFEKTYGKKSSKGNKGTGEGTENSTNRRLPEEASEVSSVLLIFSFSCGRKVEARGSLNFVRPSGGLYGCMQFVLERQTRSQIRAQVKESRLGCYSHAVAFESDCIAFEMQPKIPYLMPLPSSR